MASTHIAMRRYTVDPNQMFIKALAVSVAAYMQRENQTPTLAHVSLCHQQVPERIGPVRIVRAWGLYPNEIDLGVE